MTELLENLATNLVKPENRSKLASFMGVVRDVVSTQPRVDISETGDSMTVRVIDGMPVLSISKSFMENMNSYSVSVNLSQMLEKNITYSSDIKTVEKAIIDIEPQINISENMIEFSNDGGLYTMKPKPGLFESLENIQLVNMLKRKNLPFAVFNSLKIELESKGYTIVFAGQAIPTPVSTPPPLLDNAFRVVEDKEIIEKVIIKEVPVYVDRIVLKEVPVEVQKVIIKEVPVYIERATSKGPISDQEESEQEDEESESVVEDSEEDEESEHEDEESVIEDSEDDESVIETTEEESEYESEEDQQGEDSVVETNDEESAISPINVRNIKGRWLNNNKTILKSGEFVYRVVKKIDGPTELHALGRWDRKLQKRVGLKKGDKSIIKKLGHSIA